MTDPLLTVREGSSLLRISVPTYRQFEPKGLRVLGSNRARFDGQYGEFAMVGQHIRGNFPGRLAWAFLESPVLAAEHPLW